MAENKTDVCISKPFVLKGYWFLPDDNDHQVAGILTYSPGETVKLELIGSIVGMVDSFEYLNRLSSEPSIPVIYGMTSEGKAVTLFECTVISASTNSNCPFPMETYSCSFLLFGVFLSDRSESCICKSFVEIPAIDSFIRERPFETTHFNDGAFGVKANSRDIDNCENTVRINGFSFSLTNAAGWHTDYLNTATFRSRPTLIIGSDNPYSLDDHLRFSHLFLQFLTISSLSPTSSTRVTLRCKVDDLDNNETDSCRTVELVYAHHAVTTKPKLHESLLDYKTIKDDYESIMRKWFSDDEKLGPIKAHLIEVIIDSSHYTSAQFLLMIQAVEGYYYRYIKDNEKLKTLLTNLKEDFNNVDKVSNMSLNIDAIVESRHYYSHFMPASKKPRTMYGNDLAVATSQLRVLLICCMLRIMGFDNDRINVTLNSCHNSMAEQINFR